jgi:hypothetical protein
MKKISVVIIIASVCFALPTALEAGDKKAKKLKKVKKANAKKVKKARDATKKTARKAASEAKKKAKRAEESAKNPRKELVKKSRDLNGNGKVTKHERRLSHRSLSGQRATASFFKKHDKNRDGKISVTEAPKGKKIGWFKRADTNKNNFLDRGEYFRHIRPALIKKGRNFHLKDQARKRRAAEKSDKKDEPRKKIKKATKTASSP